MKTTYAGSDWNERYIRHFIQNKPFLWYNNGIIFNVQFFMTNIQKPPEMSEIPPRPKKAPNAFDLKKAHKEARAAMMGKSREGVDQLKSKIKQPERPKTQAELMETIQKTTGKEREEAIYQAIKSKEDLPQFQNVRATMKDSRGISHDVVLSITKTCIKVNGILMPMTPETAQRIVKKCKCTLPTKAIIDAFSADPAVKKVVMPTLPAGPQMASTRYYEEHDRLVREQMNMAGIPEDSAVSGDKKIILIGEKLRKYPNRLLFHGGLKPNGTLWQNNTPAHHPGYVGYASGAMAVEEMVSIDGEKMSIFEAERRWPGILGGGVNFNPYAFYQTKGLANVPAIPGRERRFALPTRKASPPVIKYRTPPAYVSVAPSIPAPYVSSTLPTHREVPKKTPAFHESREKVPPVEGNTLFTGDSITVGMPKHIEVKGKKETLAKVGQTSGWLLGKMKEFDAKGRLGEFENFVCLIGTNDIGGPKSAKQIFENIREILAIAKRSGLKIYICTIPPFGGFGNYASRYTRINEKRKEINNFIIESGKSGGFHVIPLHTLTSGGDDETLSKKFDAGDHLHLQKGGLAKLLQKEISG